MRDRNPFGGPGGGGFTGGLAGPVPKDIWLLLGVLFVTFSLQFFQSTAWLPALLRLTPAVWMSGFVWQLVTYPYIGIGAPNFWFLLALLIMIMFGRDVFSRLGRKQFWRLLVFASGAAAIAAVIVGLLTHWIGGVAALQGSFVLMQGQGMVLTILIAAFATMNRNATIMLFFVLPIQAKWFIPLEIVFAFLGYLGTRDFAGFIGLCVAVGFTYGALTGWKTDLLLPRLRLRLQQIWLKLRLAWMRRRRGMRVVRDDDPPRKGPWVN